jgi:hypothetical protein
LEKLTTSWAVGIVANMKARNLVDRRIVLTPTAFVELVLWEAPTPIKGSAHSYKYRLALVVRGVCVLRYDNEAGKGDHIHADGEERPYRFTTVERLIADFRADAKERVDGDGHA